MKNIIRDVVESNRLWLLCGNAIRTIFDFVDKFIKSE